MKRATKNLGKRARRLQSSQIRKNKREEVLQQKRNFGGFHSAPILLCIIALQKDVDADNILSVITKADESATIISSPRGTIHLRYNATMINDK